MPRNFVSPGAKVPASIVSTGEARENVPTDDEFSAFTSAENAAQVPPPIPSSLVSPAGDVPGAYHMSDEDRLSPRRGTR